MEIDLEMGGKIMLGGGFALKMAQSLCEKTQSIMSCVGEMLKGMVCGRERGGGLLKQD